MKDLAAKYTWFDSIFTEVWREVSPGEKSPKDLHCSAFRSQTDSINRVIVLAAQVILRNRENNDTTSKK